MGFLSITMGLVLLIYFDVRAQWSQREEANRLLIMALFRMSQRQIKSIDEQTRHVDALLEELRAGTVRLDPVLVADVAQEMDTAEEEAADEEAQRAAAPPSGKRRSGRQ